MLNRLCCALLFASLALPALHAQCALDRAIQLHQAGELQGAIRAYEACIAAEPNRVEARSNLGAVLAKLGRYQDAIDQYQAALKVAPRRRPGFASTLGWPTTSPFKSRKRPPNSKPPSRPARRLEPRAPTRRLPPRTGEFRTPSTF